MDHTIIVLLTVTILITVGAFFVPRQLMRQLLYFGYILGGCGVVTFFFVPASDRSRHVLVSTLLSLGAIWLCLSTVFAYVVSGIYGRGRFAKTNVKSKNSDDSADAP